MFNSDINSLDEVKEDVKDVFEQYNLVPSDKTNFLQFKNYSRKVNFQGRVSYNGNASFFFDPLEATSITNIDIANYKINLSIRVMEEQIEKEAMEKYGSKDSGASLGAILGKALGRDKKED